MGPISTLLAEASLADKGSTVLGAGLALLAFSAPLTTAIYGRYFRRQSPKQSHDLNGSGAVTFREFSDFRTEMKVALAHIETTLDELVDKMK